MRRLRLFQLAAIALLSALAGRLDGALAATNGTPDTMAALGDSITRAFNADPNVFGDQPQNSWSTGTNADIQSQYLRILQGNPNISSKNYNYAVSGAKMIDLNSQATNVNGTPGGVEYVTIEMGGNDVCTSSEETMTPAATYRSQFQTAMDTLTTGFPNRRVFVASVPDVFQLWQILHTNSSAVFVWNLADICQSMLENPTSLAQADVDRRARVRQRNIDFNSQLAEVCSLYSQCQFDNNAVFNFQFAQSDVSTTDYFHPSLSGQTNLAGGTWAVYDIDGDGWSSAAEATIGTDPLARCGTDAWPVDINNDGFSDISDISALGSSFGKAVQPAGPAPGRYDIAPDPPDGFVDITDISRMGGFFGKGCGP